MQTVKYHLLAQTDASDSLDSIGTFTTLNAAIKEAEKEAKDKNGTYGPDSRFVITEQKGQSYAIVQIGVVPQTVLIWEI